MRTFSLAVRSFTAWPILLVVFFAIDVIRCLRVLPIPDGDAIVFYPVYSSIANTGDLSSPVVSPLSTGGGPFTWHGWLQPLLLGHATRLFGGGISGALFSEAIVKQIGLVLFVLGVRRTAKVDHVTAIAGSTIVFASLSASQGRPELLASVLLLAWLFLDARNGQLCLHPLLAGTFLGLLGATQPTVATLASGLFLVALLLTNPMGTALRSWIAANIGAALLLAVMLAAPYPFSLLDWIAGLQQSAAKVISRSDVGGFFKFWVANRERPLHGLLAVVAAAALGWSVLQRAGYAVIFGYAATIAFCLVRDIANTDLGIRSCDCWPRGDSPGIREIVTAVRVPLWCWGGGGLLHCRHASMLDGRDSAWAYGQLRALSNEGKVKMEVPAPLLIGAVPFSEWPLYRVSSDAIECPRDRAVLLVRKQANSGLFSPDALPGCDLISNNFSDPIRFGTLRWPLVPASYGFAVYRRAQ